MTIYRIFDDNVVLDPSTTAPAGWSIGTFADAINVARTNARALFVKPGDYNAADIDILSTNGGGRPIRVFATPGSVNIKFTGGNYCIQIKDVSNVVFSGINFTGQNNALPVYTAPNAATVTAAGLFILNNARNFRIENCRFSDLRKIATEYLSSYKAQIMMANGSTGTVEKCDFSNGDVGIWNFRSRINIYNNSIDGFQTNGIMIYDLGTNSNFTKISDNHINNIEAPYGNGQTGNGIVSYQANNLTISNNSITNCLYSGIRCNASSKSLIVGNIISKARETAIFAEAPGAGQNMLGSVIANNSIEASGNGINVANSGLHNDGISRLSVVKGNLIVGLVKNSIAAIASAAASVTAAQAIGVEQDCVVEGNVIENCALGLKLGVAQAARDLSCTGNVVRNATVGIAFSSNAAASNIVISNNVLRNTPGGAILSTPSLGASPVTATYSASTLSQTAGTGGTVLISSNRAA